MTDATIAAFQFATATQIVFGWGAVSRIGEWVRTPGSPAFVVTGGDPNRSRQLLDLLLAAGIDAVPCVVRGEPTVDGAREAVLAARRAGCVQVIAFGGGSVIDTGKAVAALLANEGDPLDYLEIVGRGRALTHRSIPFIAIPTTAGTGSEVTRNAVLAVPERRVKVSLRSAHMLPAVALVDPELTLSMPPAVTASTGLDALTQLIEPFVSRHANPITDALCREGMARASMSLLRAFSDGGNVAARSNMALASLMGGLALANAGLGAAHGFAGPIGGLFDGAPHGAICAAVLPYVMSTNVRTLQEREPGHPALARYAEIGKILTGNPLAGVRDAIDQVAGLCQGLKAPGLREYGVGAADIDTIIEKAAVASSMQANPIRLTAAEMAEILASAL